MTKAIDVHVHPPTEDYLLESGGEFVQAGADIFGVDLDDLIKPMSETVEEYENAGVEKAVLLAWDAESNTDRPRVTNEWVAEMCNEYRMFLGFASVDPHKGKVAQREARHAIEDLGLDGFKFQQVAQGFYPNDQRFDPLWDTLEELGKPVLFHGGHTGLGGGRPGGMGMKLKYSKPIPYIDDVAAEHPDLPIIIAHPAWPWHKEQLSISMHKTNVYIDLSGWKPQYIPDDVLSHSRRQLQDRVMFGTDYPFITPEEWITDFEELDFDPDVQSKILYDNAAELFDI